MISPSTEREHRHTETVHRKQQTIPVGFREIIQNFNEASEQPDKLTSSESDNQPF